MKANDRKTQWVNIISFIQIQIEFLVVDKEGYLLCLFRDRKSLRDLQRFKMRYLSETMTEKNSLNLTAQSGLVCIQ